MNVFEVIANKMNELIKLEHERSNILIANKILVLDEVEIKRQRKVIAIYKDIADIMDAEEQKS